MASSSSYLSPALHAPDFSPTVYANSLVLSTNNPSDTPLDLSTPLSRVLFDVQEVDTHIDTLTTQSALPIVQHTGSQNDSAKRILDTVEEQVEGLNESFARLQREVVERYEAAEEVRLASERMLKTLRLGRSVQRVVNLGRQLQGSMGEVERAGGGYKSMVPAARTVLELRDCFAGSEGAMFAKVEVAATVRQEVGSGLERALLEKCRSVVREFSMSSLGGASAGEKTFAQAEETKRRAEASMQTLYLLSSVKGGGKVSMEEFEPALLMQALKSYLDTAITSGLAALSRALATLPMLDRALLDISARCQNVIALEALLETVKPPSGHPGVEYTSHFGDLLQPLLRHLETSALPSYFWRSMASQLTSRVQDILSRGGVSARTLRSNRNHVRDAVRECVDRGYRGKFAGKGQVEKGNWEREAAVMVGSIIGPLGR
ncbi:putative oligomeric Golgi complex subunit 5 protein [Septoria linicola]|nr:putative oligomeric Golgi complex subunit 5 protein [Septoria linicola]